MATRTFTGAAGTGNIGTAGNWDTAPSAGDDLVFDRTSYDLTGDITGTGEMNSVSITSGYKGRNIGTASTPLKIKMDSTSPAANSIFTIASGPYLELCHVSAGASGSIQTIKANGVRQLVLSLAQTITNLECDNVGSLVVATDVTITNYLLARTKAFVDILGTATGASSIRLLQGADLTINRACATSAAVTTTIATGATLRVMDPAALGDASATAGGVDRGVVYCDGYLNVRTGQSMPTVFVGNTGRVDYLGAEKNITIHTLRAWSDAIVQRKAPGVSVTISNELPVANRS